MSEENRRLVQQSFDWWNRGEMGKLRALYHPDAIMRAPEGWPEPGPFLGTDAIFDQFGRIREAWDQDSFEVLSEFLDIGDRVLARVAWRMAGHGPESSMEFTVVYTIRASLIMAIELLRDHAEALEFAGLAE